jgi:predicted double-glycine peptidase
MLYEEAEPTKATSVKRRDCATPVCALSIVSAVLVAALAGLIIVDLRHDGDAPCRNDGSGGAAAPSPSTLFYGIPMHHQETDYTCGPSSALAVLAAYGINVSEPQLAQEMHTTSANGTSWFDIARVMVYRGFTLTAGEGVSIATVTQNLQLGRLTIVGYQAWSGVPGINTTADWDDSHYSVIIGYNATGVLLMDPWQPYGTYGYAPYAEFQQQWHFVVQRQWYRFAMTLWMEGRSLPPPNTAVPSNVALTPP